GMPRSNLEGPRRVLVKVPAFLLVCPFPGAAVGRPSPGNRQEVQYLSRPSVAAGHCKRRRSQETTCATFRPGGKLQRSALPRLCLLASPAMAASTCRKAGRG